VVVHSGRQGHTTPNVKHNHNFWEPIWWRGYWFTYHTVNKFSSTIIQCKNQHMQLYTKTLSVPLLKFRKTASPLCHLQFICKIYYIWWCGLLSSKSAAVYQISSKYGWFFVDLWRFNDFQDGDCPPSFLNLQLMSRDLYCHAILLPMAAELGQNGGCLPSWILKIFIFITWLLLGYQISSKLDDISLKYGNVSIFKTVAVHHLGFVVTSQYCIRGYIFMVSILY